MLTLLLKHCPVPNPYTSYLLFGISFILFRPVRFLLLLVVTFYFLVHNGTIWYFLILFGYMSHLCFPSPILKESPQTLEGIDWLGGWAIVGSYLQISRIFEHLLHNLWGQTILGKVLNAREEGPGPKKQVPLWLGKRPSRNWMPSQKGEVLQSKYAQRIRLFSSGPKKAALF